jgi:ABC-type sugar transport system permease subunit
MSVRGSERWIPYLFLIPAFVGLLLFKLYPILFAIGKSFLTSPFGGEAQRFAGFGNYIALFTDPVFWQSLKTTLLFNLIINPLQTAVALGLALLVNVSVRGIGLFRSIFFIPVAVPFAVATVLWGMMLDSQSGLVNGMLLSIGLSAQPFLDSSSQALGAIMAIATWKGVGYWMIFFLAGLQGIPKALYEAASLDGASPLRQLLSITLPLLRPVIVIVLIADTAINFLLFAPVQILTRGGPQGSTNLLMYESYRSGIEGLDLGRSSAITVVLLILILITVAIQQRVVSRGTGP